MATIKDYRDRESYIKKANEVESQYGIPHNLLVGLLKTESAFNKDVISGKRKSSAGAIGIAQFMPNTAKEFGIDPTNPIQSIEAAGKYLSNNYKKLGDWDDTLRSYNMGLGGVQKWKAGRRNLPKETQEYVGKVYKNAKIEYKPTNYNYSNTPIADEAIRQANVYFEDTPTNAVKDLPNTEEIVNFTPEEDEIEEVEDKDIQEVKQQTKEYNFLEEYKALVNQQQPIQEEEIIQEQQIPKKNLTDIYNEVSQFIDTPTTYAQQGIALNTGLTGTALMNNLPKNKSDKRKPSDIVKVKSSLNEGEINYVRTTNSLEGLDKRKKPIEQNAVNDFVDWYSHPATKERFTKNTGLDANRLQDFVAKGLRTPMREAESNEDIGYLSKLGADALYTSPYFQQANQRTTNSKTGEILYQRQRESTSYSKAPNMQSVLGHELTHASNIDGVLAPALQRVLGDVNSQKKGTFKRDREYLEHPEESYGNFHMFRQNLGLKPGQKINEDQLKKLVEEKGLDEEIFYKAYDDDKIVKAINTIADISKDQGNVYAQTGCKIIKDQKGQINHPWQITEIQGNKMTSEGYGDYITLFVKPNAGKPQIIKPNTGEYTFEGATKFTEYPITENEEKFLKYIKKIR